MAHPKTTLKSKNKGITLNELHLSNEVRNRINQLIEEFTYKDALNNLNIPVDNKILLHGHTGCGKTATAIAIGITLNKKVITLNLAGFVSSRLGETGKNLAEVFKKASIDNAIIFIDEFDFIGKLRDYDNKDSGEMKRLVNTLIQQIDHLDDNTLLIGATNHLDIIDTALLRRFQIKLKYELPDKKNLDSYYDAILSTFPTAINEIERTYGISYAEAKDKALQQIKANVIQFEKQKKHLLFSYNPLKLNGVQIHQNGTKLNGTEDTLSGYKLIALDTKETFGNDNGITNRHSIAIKSKEKDDEIKGFVFEISGEKLMQTDKLKLSNSKRVIETTKLGTKVWVYVAHNSL